MNLENHQDRKRLLSDLRDRAGDLVDGVSKDQIEKYLDVVLSFNSKGGTDLPGLLVYLLQTNTDREESAQKRQLQVENEKAGAVPIPLELRADSAITSEAILRAIDQQVRNFREFRFRTPEPPFPSLTEAALWIEKNSRKKLRTVTLGKTPGWRRMLEIDSQIDELVGEMEELRNEPFPMVWESPQVPYYRPNRSGVLGIHTAVPRLGSVLQEISEFSKGHSKRTGFTEADLVAYVLTGKRPELPRAIVTQSKSEKGWPSEIVITFKAQNISKKDMDLALEAVRTVSGRSSRPLDDLDLAVWDVVNELGGSPEPEERQQDFFERVRQAIDDRYGTCPWKNWRGPDRRWRRMMKDCPWLKKLWQEYRDSVSRGPGWWNC